MTDIRVDVEERWAVIEEFPGYEISDRGNIYNARRNRMMKTSFTSYGHVKITLVGDDGRRHTRSVAQLVAEAFVEPPNSRCDQVVVMDGDFTNLVSENLVWRPTWYAYQYTRQMKREHPNHYYNLPIINVTTGRTYESIVDAGTREGLLFTEVWRSTYTGDKIFPFWFLFEVLYERV